VYKTVLSFHLEDSYGFINGNFIRPIAIQVNAKVNVKLSCAHHEDVWGNRGIAPFIINVGTRCDGLPPLLPVPSTRAVPTEYETGWTPQPVSDLWGEDEWLTSAENRAQIPSLFRFSPINYTDYAIASYFFSELQTNGKTEERTLYNRQK
jgi:hypothetical protein